MGISTLLSMTLKCSHNRCKFDLEFPKGGKKLQNYYLFQEHIPCGNFKNLLDFIKG
jgi:hypothetical protein